MVSTRCTCCKPASAYNLASQNTKKNIETFTIAVGQLAIFSLVER